MRTGVNVSYGLRQALRDRRLSPKALAVSIEGICALRSRIAQ